MDNLLARFRAVTNRTERNCHRQKQLAKKLTVFSLLALSSLGALAHHFADTGKMVEAPCPLYYAADVQDYERELSYLRRVIRQEREKNASLVVQTQTVKGELQEAKSNLPPIYKYARSPYASIRDAWNYAINLTLKHEGGYGIDNNGYPVNFGINQAFYHPLPGYPKQVKHLTKQQAINYYKVFYWQPLKVSSCSAQYQAFMFDTAVNKGVGTAIKMHGAANCDLNKAIALRKAHIYEWAAHSKTNQRYTKGLIARINSYKKEGIV